MTAVDGLVWKNNTFCAFWTDELYIEINRPGQVGQERFLISSWYQKLSGKLDGVKYIERNKNVPKMTDVNQKMMRNEVVSSEIYFRKELERYWKIILYRGHIHFLKLNLILNKA